jgi:CheY-like chemotaxis protein
MSDPQSTFIGVEPVLLVVDDEKMQEIALTPPLKRHHIKTVFCLSGKECLQILKDRNDISLILLDLIMPEMDGFETIKCINKTHPNLPVIAVSASASKHDIETCNEYGFSDTLLKPLSVTNIVKKFEYYSNQKTINHTSAHKDTKDIKDIKDIKRTLIQHLVQTREDLIISISQRNITKIGQHLHSLRENPLLLQIEALAQQIENMQLSLQNNRLNGPLVNNFTTFLNHFIQSEKSKLQ